MSRIKIKNFGPIKEGYLEDDGWMDVKKVTVFIGNQGSGKSTVAKLISTFTWIEKALTRGDYDIKWFSRKNKLRNKYLTYHRLENYISKTENQDNTEIEYKGESYHFKYKNGNLYIEKEKTGRYPLPQIMYVPAERNFVAYVKKAKALNLTSDSLIEFVTEFDNAKNEMKGSMPLPINDVDVEYNKLNDIIYIKGKDYKIKLTEASSGFQSLVPLYLVSWFLANSVKSKRENAKELMTSEQRERFRKQVQLIIKNADLTDEQKRIAISEEAFRFNKTAFINIVEEPEQNLYPSSQWQLLKSLLDFNNGNEGNKLIMTTHSPYIINYLSIAIQGKYLKDKIDKSKNSKELLERLEEIVPEDSLVSHLDAIVYQLEESSGTIRRLPNPFGIPSDKNYLNNMLAEGNRLFDSLLEIEEEI
ncbi:MAG: AAA family ATPase [Bacteroidetes bacterium]|nr:AAA family ATPase [Bacteroidota bacterium]